MQRSRKTRRMVLQDTAIADKRTNFKMVHSTEIRFVSAYNSMLDCVVFVFNTMLIKEKRGVSADDVNNAIAEIRKAYRLISMNPNVPIVDYNKTSFRCAYVYINFVCHTSLVWNRVQNFKKFYEADCINMMKYDSTKLKICSLGGGPGCDIIGLLGARSEMKGLGETRSFSCTVVDMYSEWKTSFNYGLNAFLNTQIGSAYAGFIHSDFITSNLCQPLSNAAKNAIMEADIVTLVRYVSVVSGYYDEHRNQLTTIFECLKTGAYAFYIDNSIQRLYRMVASVAVAAGLTPIYPRKYCRRYLSSRTMSRIKAEFKSKPSKIATVFFCVWQKRG